MGKKVRLKQALVKSGSVESMAEATKMIHDKHVTIDDKVVTNTEFQVDVKKQDVRFLGKNIIFTQTLYFLFNKPLGVTCQKGKEKNVYQYLDRISWLTQEEKQSLFFVGRLDKGTYGLMIVTNDGDLAKKMLSTSVEKTYRVVAKGKLRNDAVKQLEAGIEIQVDGEKYTTRKAKVKFFKSAERQSSFHLIITEGKKHQVRLMVEAIGGKVLELERVAIGDLKLLRMTRGTFKKMRTITL